MPNHKMAQEIHAKGGMGFNKSNTGLTIALIYLLSAMSIPNGTAILDAIAKPIRTR